MRTSRWRQDPAAVVAVVIVGGLVSAAVLIAVLGQPPGSGSGPRFVSEASEEVHFDHWDNGSTGLRTSATSQMPPWALVGAVAIGGAVGAVLLFTMVATYRDRRVRFSTLPPEEQQRRKEAARLLRELGESDPPDPGLSP